MFLVVLIASSFFYLISKKARRVAAVSAFLFVDKMYWCSSYIKRTDVLRASFCKYRKSGDSFKIFTFFIFCPNKAFSELFSKIQLKDPKALEFFQNRGKFENRHFGLPPSLKIDKNDAFSFRSRW